MIFGKSIPSWSRMAIAGSAWKLEKTGQGREEKFPAEPEGRTSGGRGVASAGVQEGLAALEGENEGVNGDSFGERHADNGDGEDVTEGTGVAAHGLSSGKTGQTNAQTRTGTGQAEGEGTVDIAGLGEFVGGFGDSRVSG